TIKLDASARDWLADRGWDPAYGARPLKRVIQKAVQDPLAEMILAGTIKDGEKVTVSGDKRGLTFNGKLAQAAEARLSVMAGLVIVSRVYPTYAYLTYSEVEQARPLMPSTPFVLNEQNVDARHIGVQSTPFFRTANAGHDESKGFAEVSLSYGCTA